MPKKERVTEDEQVSNVEEAEQPAPEEKAADPNAGLVRMKRDGRIIHAHPTAIADHTKNGWKVA